MTHTTDVPAERERDELRAEVERRRDAVRSLTVREGTVGYWSIVAGHKREVKFWDRILALLAPQEPQPGPYRVDEPPPDAAVALGEGPSVLDADGLFVCEANDLATARKIAAALNAAAPQEAREPEAESTLAELVENVAKAARMYGVGSEACVAAQRAVLAAARPAPPRSIFLERPSAPLFRGSAPETEREPTRAEIDDACMWYRHDFGLMSDEDAGRLRFTAREWLRAWHKAGARVLLGAPAPAEATEPDSPKWASRRIAELAERDFERVNMPEAEATERSES